MMNGAMIQQLLVLLVMATAAAWLVRRAWRTLRASSGAKKSSPGAGCDGCGPGGH